MISFMTKIENYKWFDLLSSSSIKLDSEESDECLEHWELCDPFNQQLDEFQYLCIGKNLVYVWWCEEGDVVV